MNKPMILLGAALMALSLTACSPPEESQNAKGSVSNLKLEVTGGVAKVNNKIQLALKFEGGDDGQAMMGAMIDKADPPTTWHAEPEGLVEFDQKTAQITLLEEGTVKIWATYKQDDKDMKSNVVELEIKREGEGLTASTK